MRTMYSFGTMPTKREFHSAWNREIGEGSQFTYQYTFRGGDAASARSARVPVEGSFNEKQIYSTVKKLRDAYFKKGDENAGSLASSLLSTLGFEWV